MLSKELRWLAGGVVVVVVMAFSRVTTSLTLASLTRVSVNFGE
jgi:hypothetical protein